MTVITTRRHEASGDWEIEVRDTAGTILHASTWQDVAMAMRTLLALHDLFPNAVQVREG